MSLNMPPNAKTLASALPSDDAGSAPEPIETRRPGELVFAVFLLGASLVLLWNAYGIAGFEALSSPGAIPMATTFAMVVTAALSLVKIAKLGRNSTQTLSKDILPGRVLLFVGFLVGYGVLLEPLGFLPTSALFLIVAFKVLAQRSWLWTLGTALGSLLVIWLIFRIVFTVLMPSGVVPEAEFIQLLRNLTQGGGQGA